MYSKFLSLFCWWRGRHGPFATSILLDDNNIPVTKYLLCRDCGRILKSYKL